MTTTSLSPDERTALELKVRGEARALVAGTLARHPGWAPPPFDPVRLAGTLGIPVGFSARLDPWDALIAPVDRGFRILCNARRSPGRRNFSIGHEICHTFLPGARETIHHRSEHRREYAPEAFVERLCDLGAAELLMPADCFGHETAAAGGLRAGAVVALAERFAVSLEAAAVRLVETAESPCAAGFFHFGLRPSARRGTGVAGGAADAEMHYRAHRVFHAKGFPHLFPPGKSVPDASAVFRAYAGDAELSGVEEFLLEGERIPVRVTAVPTGRSDRELGAPIIAAVFTLA